MSSPIFDPGLQPERTRLAWRRTLLALAVGSVLALRVLPERVGSWAYAMAIVGFLAAAYLAVATHRRSATADRALASREELPGAATLLTLSVAVAVLATMSAAALLAQSS